MKLTEVLEDSRSAEAAIEGGTALVERATDVNDVTQSYWYDIRQGSKRRHSDAYGTFGDLEDMSEVLSDALSLFDIEDVEVLDWHGTTRVVDFSDCRCRECKIFCLERGIMPPGIPLHEAAWHRASFAVRDVRWWCWFRWLWLKEYRWRRQMRAEYEASQHCEEQEEA
jgi:hypothetical protein